MALDHFDMALLDAVQRDAGTSQLDLGAEVNLSSAAVNRRLKKMSADGVIRGTVAQVNAEKLGYTLTVITEVEVENERLDLLDDMKKAFLACPQVQQCFYIDDVTRQSKRRLLLEQYQMRQQELHAVVEKNQLPIAYELESPSCPPSTGK